jgi:hypothetical protein
MDNSNEMEVMLESQKAYGVEDRGYYQLDGPIGRKTRDKLATP